MISNQIICGDWKRLTTRSVQMLHEGNQTRQAPIKFDFTQGCCEQMASTPNDAHV